MATERLTNWGRWGDEDERGTLNLLTPERILQAATLVRRGRVYSLQTPLSKDGPIAPSRSPLWHRTMISSRPGPVMGAADDVILMHTHGTTHVDALCHVFFDNQMYNGYRASESIHPTTGASRNGIHNVEALVGRGVLLDIAGQRGVAHLDLNEEITPQELDACARAQGVEVRPGDIVMIRTGWLRVFEEDRELFDSGCPGPNGDVAAWFREHDLCAMGADNVAVETMAHRPGHPLHVSIIRDQGGYLLEFVNLEEIAVDRVYEFLFVAAPLRLLNGIGSPINPLAIC